MRARGNSVEFSVHANEAATPTGHGARLSTELGLLLQLISHSHSRVVVHSLGTVLLDVLRDPKLPNRFVEVLCSRPSLIMKILPPPLSFMFST